MKQLKNRMTAGLALLASLAAVGITSSATAQLITLSAGNFTINANGYSASTIFTQAPGALPVQPQPPFVPDPQNPTPPTLEDTWGIFQITSILNGSTPVFDDNSGVEYFGMFYNSYDTSSTTSGNTILFQGTGLRLDIYRVNVLDTDDLIFAAAFNQGTAGRLGLSSFNLITNVGTLALSSSLVGNLESAYFGTTQTTSANGLLSVTTNNLFDLGMNQLSQLTFALGGVTNDPPANWTVAFDGPITGTVTPIPEPSTYGVMAAGALAGIVALRRRMQKSKQG